MRLFIFSLCVLNMTSFLQRFNYCSRKNITLTQVSSFNWSLPVPVNELYNPPVLVPLIPYDLARSIVLEKYISSLKNDDEISIQQCESFRKYIIHNEKNNTIPKAHCGLVGDDYLVAFTALNQFGSNIVSIYNVLPLYNKNLYNISTMLTVIKVQYKPCTIKTSTLVPYWKNIFHLYTIF